MIMTVIGLLYDTCQLTSAFYHHPQSHKWNDRGDGLGYVIGSSPVSYGDGDH